MQKNDNNRFEDENIFIRTEVRSYYIDLPEGGPRVWVDEETYKNYARIQNAEDKRLYNEGRCLIPAERGTFKRCMESCSECPLKRTGYTLSLDHHQEEYGYEASDDSDLVAEIKLQEVKDKLQEEVSLLSILDQKILSLYEKDFSEREIGAKVGLSQKAVNLRLKKCIELLKQKLSGF